MTDEIIVDFHVHAFPDRVTELLPERTKLPIAILRRQARLWLKPFARSLHRVQTVLRYFPEPTRNVLDEVTALAPIPNLLFESTPEDLKEVLESAKVSHAVAIAHPPLIPNDLILNLAEEDPKIIPAVYIPKDTMRPGSLLEEYAGRGAKILKIHPASDGEGEDSPRYLALLRAAEKLGMPVIIHTGCFHSRFFFKDTEKARAETFAPWFKDHPGVTFILAHMNYHDPGIAIDLAEEYPNIYLDTSWQPSEVIGEAARRIGAERVLFGSDWPLIGNNISVGIKRVRECEAIGILNPEQVKLILGENAVRILGLKGLKANAD